MVYNYNKIVTIKANKKEIIDIITNTEKLAEEYSNNADLYSKFNIVVKLLKDIDSTLDELNGKEIAKEYYGK